MEFRQIGKRPTEIEGRRRVVRVFEGVLDRTARMDRAKPKPPRPLPVPGGLVLYRGEFLTAEELAAVLAEEKGSR